MADRQSVLIVGAGSGLSASLARLGAREGMAVTLAARNVDKLAALAKETGAKTIACDASDPAAVARLFAETDRAGTPDWVIYNASGRARGPIGDLDPEAVRQAVLVSSYGAFLVAQQAAARMLKRGSGSIFFTGASASVKGYARSSAFAMGKFAQRGLAQALARELAPQNIHVAHFVIDGGIGKADDPRGAGKAPDAMLDPDAIAESYLAIHRQHRSAWTWEIELRPWVESF
ncbi:MAG: SDR family NAD(P)-dependent oxidoreductase [Alphaproteobacteria bacterium]|nr:SDR family NAD(P)-dependent oxidoreductase [Alphaproteobacteria bacterium]